MPGDDYALVDCGGGRRLERFSGVTVSRPAPAAPFPRTAPLTSWNYAALSFAREHGWSGCPPAIWRVDFGGAIMNLQPASGGQLGVFPEHVRVAERLEQLLSRLPPPMSGRRVLNMFAHTGLVTLRLARASGVRSVVHVDSAPAAVKRARQNAADSGLADAGIRWLVDDALSFMRREARRGNVYDVIVADPPAYGRDRKSRGEWKLERDLPELLDLTDRLLAAEGAVLCLTCHPAGWNADGLAAAVRRSVSGLQNLECRNLTLPAESGATLPAGLAALAWDGPGFGA